MKVSTSHGEESFDILEQVWSGHQTESGKFTGCLDLNIVTHRKYEINLVVCTGNAHYRMCIVLCSRLSLIS